MHVTDRFFSVARKTMCLSQQCKDNWEPGIEVSFVLQVMNFC